MSLFWLRIQHVLLKCFRSRLICSDASFLPSSSLSTRQYNQIMMHNSLDKVAPSIPYFSRCHFAKLNLKVFFFVWITYTVSQRISADDLDFLQFRKMTLNLYSIKERANKVENRTWWCSFFLNCIVFSHITTRN